MRWIRQGCIISLVLARQPALRPGTKEMVQPLSNLPHMPSLWSTAHGRAHSPMSASLSTSDCSLVAKSSIVTCPPDSTRQPAIDTGHKHTVQHAVSCFAAAAAAAPAVPAPAAPAALSTPHEHRRRPWLSTRLYAASKTRSGARLDSAEPGDVAGVAAVVGRGVPAWAAERPEPEEHRELGPEDHAGELAGAGLEHLRNQRDAMAGGLDSGWSSSLWCRRQSVPGLSTGKPLWVQLFSARKTSTAGTISMKVTT